MLIQTIYYNMSWACFFPTESCTKVKRLPTLLLLPYRVDIGAPDTNFVSIATQVLRQSWRSTGKNLHFSKLFKNLGVFQKSDLTADQLPIFSSTVTSSIGKVTTFEAKCLHFETTSLIRQGLLTLILKRFFNIGTRPLFLKWKSKCTINLQFVIRQLKI